MGKHLSLFLAGAFLAGTLANAKAVIVNYAVAPNGDLAFGTTVVIPADGATGTTDLLIVPSSGVLDCGASPIEMDVATLFLDTDLDIFTPTAGTDTVTVDKTFRIRLDADGVGPLLPTDWFQDIEFNITQIKEGSAVSTLTKNLFDNAFVSQTKFVDGIGDVTLFVGTFDDLGAPQDDPSATRFFRGTGAITDRIVCVPEPGTLTLLAGALIAGPMLLRRRRR
jgi:hypothetical protein